MQRKKNEIAKKRISNIQKWSNELRIRGTKDLDSIKKYLAGQSGVDNKFDAGIIETILNCREDGTRIQLNTNMFSKKLHVYLPGNDLSTRFLTDDYLYLIMTSKLVLDKYGIKDRLYDKCVLNSVKIISDNYYFSGVAETGFIQDYDPNFSIMCPKDTEQGEIAYVVQQKKNHGDFVYKGIDYKYYGDDRIVVISNYDLPDDEMPIKGAGAKFFRIAENKISEGVWSLIYNKDLCYIDKNIVPEAFCPSYWISPDVIKISCLFDFEIDYNDLYEYLDTKVDNNGMVTLPENLCYWDTLKECIMFLGVYSLASKKVSEKGDAILTNYIDDYMTLRSEIKSWKTNQLLLQRILMDFINAFINNSEFSRFVNLQNKVEQYIRTRDKLKKEHGEVITFFNSLPFTGMINNQLKDSVFGLAEQINSVLTQYINGTNPKNLPDKVREVVREIYKFLPMGTMKDAAFPFITAPGSILGGNIKLNDLGTDPIAINIDKQNKRITRNKKKEKEKTENVYNIIQNLSILIDDYLQEYITRFFKNTKTPRNGDVMRRLLSRLVKAEMDKNKDMADEITRGAIDFNTKGTIPKRISQDLLWKFLLSHSGETAKNIEKKVKEMERNIKRNERFFREAEMEIEEDDKK